jgi:hypothetical protein
MSLIENFVVNQENAMQERRVIPAGDYLLSITKQEEKLTKDKTGGILALTVSVMDGPQKGCVIWKNLNLKNKSEIAVKIATSELTSICLALGIDILKHPSQLLNKPFVGKVTEKPATYVMMSGQPVLDPVTNKPIVEYEASNEIKTYRSVGQAQPQAPQTQNAATKPWGVKPPPPEPKDDAEIF